MELYPITTKNTIAASNVPNPKEGHYSMFYNSSNNNKLSLKDSNGTVTEVGVMIDYYNSNNETPVEKREKIRVINFLKVSDINEETVIELDENQLTDFNSIDIIDVNGTFKLSLDENHLYLGNIEGLAEQKTLTEVFDAATEDMSTSIFHIVDGKVELLVEEGEVIIGDSLQRGRSSSIVSALGSLSKEVGDIFEIGIDNKVQLLGTPTHIIRFNANGEGESQSLISGINKALVTNSNGVEEEVDLISFLDLLTASNIISNGVLNTTDLGGIARGILGSWKITDIVIENTTANAVTISLGTTPNGNDILNGFVVNANVFTDNITLLTDLFSKTVEQAIYISSSNWNSANLNIKFSVKKVF